MADLIRCRDCRHWMPGRGRDDLDRYPRDQAPDSGWLDGVCNRLRDGVEITCSGGWDGCTIDSVETDANFGCVYGELPVDLPAANLGQDSDCDLE
jgi:hypothetical protein